VKLRVLQIYILEYKICQLEAVDSMSGLPRIEEYYGRDSRQLDMMTVGDTGELMAEYAPTHLRARRKAADLTISESRMSRIKEDDASDSGQEDMRTASVAGNSRVDVPAKTSDRWRALMVKMDAVGRFRSSLARFRSRKAKPEENFMRDDTSMYSPALHPFSFSDCSSFLHFFFVLLCRERVRLTISVKFT
jgi:hypothetical protein